MLTRVLWNACFAGLAVLTFSVAGCGKMKHSAAPDQAAYTAFDNGAVPPVDDDVESSSVGIDDRDAMRLAQPITGPTIISSPGHYRLTDDFVAQEDGIVIVASHVRLWLGEHRLFGPGNKVGRAVVIDGADDVTVVGGRIEHFGFGAVLLGASQCRLSRLEILGGDETADPPNGNPPQVGIMLINSGSNVVTRNRLSRVNLGIFVRGGGSSSNRIDANEVVGGDHGLLAICYNPAPVGDPAGPHDDRVRLNLLARFGTGIAASAQSAENQFELNTIRYFVSAYSDQNGTNVFRNNRTEQVAP
ncbi:MAG: right-handed parallel beta-helix repeat-containing protein [Candidatus Eiseniibacteriota bacterium]